MVYRLRLPSPGQPYGPGLPLDSLPPRRSREGSRLRPGPRPRVRAQRAPRHGRHRVAPYLRGGRVEQTADGGRVGPADTEQGPEIGLLGVLAGVAGERGVEGVDGRGVLDPP